MVNLDLDNKDFKEANRSLMLKTWVVGNSQL
jgi:hypothetical protein